MPGYRKRLETLTTDIIDGTEANHFFEMLGESQRPLIYAGGGVINGNASAELREFAEEFGIPVVTTLMGIGAMDTTSDLSMRMLGMHGQAFANYAVDDCDFLIAIGARFDDRVAGNPAKFAPGAKYIAHFDIDRAEINKVKRVQWSHVGMLPEALSMLTAHGKRSGFKRDRSKWLAYLADMKRTYAMNYDRDSEKIQPYYVIEELNRVTKGEAIISTGVGQHQMWAAQYCDFRNPRQWLTSGSMGTMGFGLPAAIGAQFAQRDKLVIDIDGDASVRMNFGELETVTTYDLPVKVVILNNNGDGMVKQWQKLFFKGRLSASEKTLHTKDFIKAAQADGFKYAVRLDKKADVPRVIEEFLAFKGAAFLEVIIDPDAGVYPMVGPGQPYEAMITGDWIPSRKKVDVKPPGASARCSSIVRIAARDEIPAHHGARHRRRRFAEVLLRRARARGASSAPTIRRASSRSSSWPRPATALRRWSSRTTGNRSRTAAAAISATWRTRSTISTRPASGCRNMA